MAELIGFFFFQVIKFAILALIGLLICKNVEGGCREHNINVWSEDRIDQEPILNVDTATDCSFLCRTKSSCQEWIWHHEGAGRWAFICVLSRGYVENSKRIDQYGTIMGDRNCHF